MNPSKLLASACCSSDIEPELSTTNRKSILLQPPIGSPVAGSIVVVSFAVSNLTAPVSSGGLPVAAAVPSCSPLVTSAAVIPPSVVSPPTVAGGVLPTEMLLAVTDPAVTCVSRPPSPESPQASASSTMQLQTTDEVRIRAP